MLSFVRIVPCDVQLKPNLDKDHDPMAGIMDLMKVYTRIYYHVIALLSFCSFS